MGSEAKNPKQNLPRAVVGVLAIVTVLYVLASLALVGMQNYVGRRVRISQSTQTDTF